MVTQLQESVKTVFAKLAMTYVDFDKLPIRFCRLLPRTRQCVRVLQGEGAGDADARDLRASSAGQVPISINQVPVLSLPYLRPYVVEEA